MPQKPPSRRIKFLVVSGAIILLVGYIAIPNYFRSRRASSSKSMRLIESGRMIEAAMDQYAIEFNQNQKTGQEIKEVDWAAVRDSLKKSGNGETPAPPTLAIDESKQTAPATSLELPNQKIQPPSTFMPSSKSMPLIPINSLPLHILSEPKIEKPDYATPPEKKP